jgi:cytochrome bd-type quinol oxidase subunit 2
MRRRHTAERIIAALVAVAMVLVCLVIGPREFVYALGEPMESPWLWLPPLVLGLGLWGALTSRRKEGPPVLAIVLGIAGSLCIAGTLFLVALAKAFQH